MSSCSLAITDREPGECGEGQSEKSKKGGACEECAWVPLGRTRSYLQRESYIRQVLNVSTLNKCGFSKAFIRVLMCVRHTVIYLSDLQSVLPTNLWRSYYPHLIKEEMSFRQIIVDMEEGKSNKSLTLSTLNTWISRPSKLHSHVVSRTRQKQLSDINISLEKALSSWGSIAMVSKPIGESWNHLGIFKCYLETFSFNWCRLWPKFDIKSSPNDSNIEQNLGTTGLWFSWETDIGYQWTRVW